MTLWTEYTSMLRGALLLKDDTFVSLRDDPDSFARGLRFLVITALIVGLVLGLYALASGWGKSPADEISTAWDAVEQQMDMMSRFGAFGEDAEVFDEIMDNMREGFGIAESVGVVVEETTGAPQGFVKLTEALGKWLSKPFAWIGFWLTWGLITLVFARLLGGTATIQQMLGVTALVVAPHLLDAFSFIPCGGVLLQAIAFFWGLFIYVKATAVANRFQAVWLGALAALAPILLLLLVLIIAVPILGLIIALN